MKNYLSIYNLELKLLKKLYEYLYQQLFNIKIFLFSPFYKINYIRSELYEIIKVLNLQGFNQSVKDTESNIIFYFLNIPKLIFNIDLFLNDKYKHDFSILEASYFNIDKMISNIRILKEKLRKCNLYSSYFNSSQTKESFDFQWENIPVGKSLLSDFSFRNDIISLITKYTKLKTSWFSNKYVLDIGCGNGRFSYGFALLKSKLTIMDQSKSAIKHTKNILKDFRIKVIKGDILKTKSLPKIKYDLVWSFGVVHHTGNTNLALKNIRKLLKNKGFLFLMVYGEPNSNTEFYEISQYNNLRKKTNELSTHEKFVYLKNRFKPKLVHGYFDAVSPNINELYSFQEIENMLLKLNFRNIQKVNKLNRNHHIICQLFE